MIGYFELFYSVFLSIIYNTYQCHLERSRRMIDSDSVDNSSHFDFAQCDMMIYQFIKSADADILIIVKTYFNVVSNND